jgi:hypothetical protein
MKEKLKISVNCGPRIHRQLIAAAKAEGVSLNQYILFRMTEFMADPWSDIFYGTRIESHANERTRKYKERL